MDYYVNLVKTIALIPNAGYAYGSVDVYRNIINADICEQFGITLVPVQYCKFIPSSMFDPLLKLSLSEFRRFISLHYALGIPINSPYHSYVGLWKHVLGEIDRETPESNEADLVAMIKDLRAENDKLKAALKAFA